MSCQHCLRFPISAVPIIINVFLLTNKQNAVWLFNRLRWNRTKNAASKPQRHEQCKAIFTFLSGLLLVEVVVRLTSRRRSCRIAAEYVCPPTKRSPICSCLRVDAKVGRWFLMAPVFSLKFYLSIKIFVEGERTLPFSNKQNIDEQTSFSLLKNL